MRSNLTLCLNIYPSAFHCENQELLKIAETNVQTFQNLSNCICNVEHFTLETSAFGELGSEFINFACNCVINTLRLIVCLTGFSI